MSEDNKDSTPTNIPSFELPKAAVPTVRFGEKEEEKAIPSFTSSRPADFGASTIQKSSGESSIMVALDAICAVVAVAFAVLTFLEMKF